MKNIIYTTEGGSVAVLVKSPKWKGSLEELAAKDVPEGVEWSIVEDLPSSRNWRDAWVCESGTVSVDLDKAKTVHKKLITAKAHERVIADDFGVQDFSVVKAEIEAIDFSAIASLEDLLNTFPASIDNRIANREYKMHG